MGGARVIVVDERSGIIRLVGVALEVYHMEWCSLRVRVANIKCMV